MKKDLKDIKAVFHKKISLFKELLNCVSRERDNLIDLDLKNIWTVMEEKQRIVNAIEETDNELKEMVGTKGNIYKNIPANERPSVMELSKTLSGLREEIRVRLEENVTFIKETLGFFHEIISIFTMGNRSEIAYSPTKSAKHKVQNVIYHNEV